MSITVLVADADDDARAATAAELEGVGMTVHEATSVDDAVEVLADHTLDCVVTEYEFPDGSGLDLLAELRQSAPDTPCVLFTDAATSDIDTTAFEGLVVEYLPKSMTDRDRVRQRIDEITSLRTQVGYPLPDDEDARLDALAQYDIDDLAIKETFDRLTELAAKHFETDVAFIGLVHEHEEEFVSCYGGDIDPLPRESTMCTHAILEQDVMVVEDVAADDRFKHNDALARLDIRSYVGAPMRTPDGRALGSFCLTDDEPREYSEEDRRYLRLMADEAMEQLVLRQRLQRTQEDEQR